MQPHGKKNRHLTEWLMILLINYLIIYQRCSTWFMTLLKNISIKLTAVSSYEWTCSTCRQSQTLLTPPIFNQVFHQIVDERAVKVLNHQLTLLTGTHHSSNLSLRTFRATMILSQDSQGTKKQFNLRSQMIRACSFREILARHKTPTFKTSMSLLSSILIGSYKSYRLLLSKHSYLIFLRLTFLFRCNIDSNEWSSRQ